MKIRFWGTRGSIPKPGPETLRFGGNTSCVELQTRAGTRIILDCGSGAQDLGQALIAAGQRPLNGHILISHTHWDHIQGLPFFAPLFVPGNEWQIYGPHGFCHSLRDALAGQMQYTYFPIALQHFSATTRYHDLVEGAFQLAELNVRTQYLNHPALTLGYRLEGDGVSIVYACDHEPYSRQLATGSGQLAGRDRAHAAFLEGADLVIHDGQYTAEEYPGKVGWGHSTVEYVTMLCRLAGVRRLAITHHDPLRSDAALDRIVETVRRDLATPQSALDVFAAAEGQVMELAPSDDRCASRSSPATHIGPPRAPALQEHTVLVVGSDQGLVHSIAESVRADSVRLRQAADGPSATRALEAEAASLVVVEHTPPGFDGLAICRAIRALGGGVGPVPVVVVAPEEDSQAGAEIGVTDWLVRPFSDVYARTRLHSWLMRSTSRWMRPPLPQDEERRLATLRRLGILDTAPEDRFDRITRLAAALCDVPIALVTLMDRDRQWFKSRHGLDVEETSREVSFCAHAILSPEVMMVPDTLEDERFADNPLVSGEPRIRFYAGCPLGLGGVRVGTLCLVDMRPRFLDETRIGLLKDLARLVEQELELPGRPAVARAPSAPPAAV